VEKFSEAERTSDRRAFTHKLNFELDTSVSIFNWLPAGRWLRGVELEGSLDYVATGLPRRHDVIEGARFGGSHSPWSLSNVFVVPVAPCSQEVQRIPSTSVMTNDLSAAVVVDR